MAKKKIKQKEFDKNQLTVAIDSLSSAFNNFDGFSTDELLAQTGKSRQELLNAVMADDEVLSCREDIMSSILAKKWRIWGKDVDEDIINQLYILVRKLASDFVGLAVLARFNGYAVAEYVFKQELNGSLSLDKVLSKDGELEQYTPKRDGSLLFKSQNGDVVMNQDVKFLLMTSNAVPARPFGEMMIIRVFPAVNLRKRGWAYAGQFIARYAQPYIVGKQGGFADINAFTNTLYGFANGGAAGINQDDSIDVHQLSGNGDAFEKIESMANARIQKLLLGRVKNSELSVGSRSAQETDDKVHQSRLVGYLDIMAKAIQHAIDAILTVNEYYGMPIHAPQGIWFEYEEQTKVDVERANRDKLYCDTGQVKLTKDYLVNIVGFEEQHIEIVDTPSNAQPNTQQDTAQNAPLSVQLSDDEQDNPSDNHDHVHDDEYQPDSKITSEKLDKILAVLDSSQDYTELEKRLAELALPDGGLIDELAKENIKQYVKGLAGVQNG
ncbi:DUF935 family protein [Acinetobacter sp. c3-l95]|uniref:phage portal protein family protein n=1 Tax=Acinetobacter sp. c3-l95 TaxID=3342804 RepID=UPI0035BAC572